MKRIMALISFFALVGMLAGCVTQSTQPPDPSVLRVAVSPNSQPVIYKQGGQILGIEADFAHKIGKALGRKVVFIEVPWSELIDSIENNKADIIMSNMTITGTRGIRINFTTPYMQSGLTGLFRRDNCDPNGLIASTIRNQTKKVGTIKDTTGDFFAIQRFGRAEKKTYANARAAVSALKSGKIDMFIYDAPMVWWLSAMNEGDLIAFPEVLNIEPIAWGVGKHNMELLDEVNALVAQWDKDGTTKRIIQNWIPSFQ